jgi:hypothetical protein
VGARCFRCLVGGANACWVARVRSLAIPGLVGGGECLLGGASTEPRDPGLGRRGRLRVGWREYGASRSRAWSEGTDVCWVARVRGLAIPGLVGGGGCLLGGASTEPRDRGVCGERACLDGVRASGLAPGKRQQASAVQGYGSRNWGRAGWESLGWAKVTAAVTGGGLAGGVRGR